MLQTETRQREITSVRHWRPRRRLQRGRLRVHCSWWILAWKWKTKMKGAAVPGARRCPDVPTVSHNNGPANGQTHAQPLRFPGKERREDTLTFLRGESDSGIFNSDVYPRLAIAPRANLNLCWANTCITDRFQSIEHQVEHNLLQLHAISHNAQFLV